MSPYFKTSALFLLATAVTLGLAGCQSGSGEAQAQGQAQAPVVNVQEIVAQCVALDIELAGRTSANTVAEVRPQVGGIIQRRLFEEGSTVKAGQPLYQIAPDSYRAAYESAAANVVALRLKASRYKELAASDAIGQQDYDDVAAALKQAEAALQTAKINLDYTHVYSPVAGRIGKSSVTVGALVTAEQATALATVQQLDPIYVDVTRSSRELLELQNQLASGAIKAAGEFGVQRHALRDDLLHIHHWQLRLALRLRLVAAWLAAAQSRSDGGRQQKNRRGLEMEGHGKALSQK